MPRRARIALLAGLTVVTIAALIALDQTGGGARSGARATTGTASLTVTTQSPATSAPTTTVPAADPTFAVTSASLVIAARNLSGRPVSIPTTVWYPKPATTTGRVTFPLVVFSPGYQIDPSAYGLLVAAWSAAGYVVAVPTYPDTAPGAPPIESDMANHPYELNQVISAVLADATDGSVPFAGLIEPGPVAVAGQSDGGDVSLAAATNSCCRDPRIAAAIILSGAEATLFGGSYFTAGDPPLLVVQGDDDRINPPPCSAQIYDQAPAVRYYLDMPAATHLSAYTEPGPQLTAVERLSTAFLDMYLKGSRLGSAELTNLGDQPHVSQLITPPVTVPISGTCPGAP